MRRPNNTVHSVPGDTANLWLFLYDSRAVNILFDLLPLPGAGLLRPFLKVAVVAALAALAGFFATPTWAQVGVYDWTGFYAGLHGGGGWSKTEGGDNTPYVVIPDMTRQNSRGGFGGAQFGYQWQLGRMVWGTELSGSLGGVSGSENCFPNSVLSPGDSLSCKVKQEWNFQFLGRLGYALGDGRFLPYFTGGLALSEVNTKKHFDVSGVFTGDWSARNTDFGAGFGGGFLYALGGGYSLGVEYLYLSFFNRDTSSMVPVSCGCGPEAALSTQSLSTQSVRISLNYTFGSPAPINSDRRYVREQAASDTYDWTGFYIGGQTGYEWAKTHGSTYAVLASLVDNIDQRSSGALGGLQFGYNHQFGHVVLGTEFSTTWKDVKDGGSCLVITGDAANCASREKWTAQFLSRFGYAFDDGRLLTYVVGGFALSRFSLHFTADDGFDIFDWGANKYLIGGVLGGGMQYALGEGYSIGVEYLYTRYGTQDFSSATTISGSPFLPSVATISPTSQSLRFVANYKFGDPKSDGGAAGRRIYDWTGFYAGFHGGGEWGKAKGSDQTPYLPVGDLTSQSIGAGFGGGQIGYNRQFGRIVLGAEFSLSYGNANGTKDCFENAAVLAGGLADYSCRLEQNWTGRYFNRLGYTSSDGRWLSYLVGGLALTKLRADRSIIDPSTMSVVDSWGQSQVHIGGILGLGLQYALQDNLSIGAEYLHTQYAAQQYTSNSVSAAAPSTFTQDLKSDVFRLVLNYKFTADR